MPAADDELHVEVDDAVALRVGVTATGGMASLRAVGPEPPHRTVGRIVILTGPAVDALVDALRSVRQQLGDHTRGRPAGGGGN